MLSILKLRISKILEPLARILAEFGLKPNHLTILGLLIGLTASILISVHLIFIGAFFVLLSGICDVLDGAMARTQDMETKFGGYLDSVFDRYVDVFILISLGIYGVDWLLIALSLSGALLVSYTRARAEKLIPKCDVGIAERGERLIILFIGMISGFIWEAVLIIAILSHITACHRIVYTYNQVRK